MLYRGKWIRVCEKKNATCFLTLLAFTIISNESKFIDPDC